MIKITGQIIRDCEYLYNNNRHQELSVGFAELLRFFHSLKSLSPEENIIFSSFMKTFLGNFIKKDFLVASEYFKTFISLNSKIAKLVAIAELNNTDSFITDLLNNKVDSIKSFSDKNILFKVLTLYSARNEIKLDYRHLFFADPDLASTWYWSYLDYKDYISQININNFEYHIDKMDIIGNRLTLPLQPSGPYYLCTYISPEKDKIVKAKINTLIRETFSFIKAENVSTKVTSCPGKAKIAIISGFLYPSHSVYKSVYRYIESLADDYDLTMIHLGEPWSVRFADIFKRVIYLKIHPLHFQNSILPVLKNDFDLIFYPDIGMTAESIFIANLRLAPIQVTAHGHSVSTYGAEIDYFISGLASENLATAKNNYSERLVLLPGIGLYPTYRTYSKQGHKKVSYKEFLILCAWSLQKINYRHLQNLKIITERSGKKIKFIFCSSVRDIYLMTINREISAILGAENIIVKGSLPHDEYLDLIEKADLIIDSFHFGGYNTVIDTLYLNKLFVSLDGGRAYNKFASAILQQIGMPELVTVSEEEYIDKIVELINNDNLRDTLTQKLESINLNARLFAMDETVYFKKAIKYLLENHELLKSDNSSEPLIIH